MYDLASTSSSAVELSAAEKGRRQPLGSSQVGPWLVCEAAPPSPVKAEAMPCLHCQLSAASALSAAAFVDSCCGVAKPHILLSLGAACLL